MYPQSLSPARQVDFALLLIFLFSAAVLLILTCIGAYFIWKYHHKKQPVAEDIRGNIVVEILWTVIPSLMVFGLFYYGWAGFKALRTVPDNAMEVAVTAKMFSWTFTYDGGKSSSYLAVPVGTPVKLNLRSLDVIHSLYIPAFRIKMDALPGGMPTYVWFVAEREGVYDIYCAEYCGVRHSAMLSTVRAMDAPAFDLWLHTGESEEGVAAGRQLLESYGCFSCHAPDIDPPVAPALDNLFGNKVTLIAGGQERQVEADEEYIKEAIEDPGKSIVKGFDNTMPAYTEFTPAQWINIMEYLRSISDHALPADHAAHGQTGGVGADGQSASGQDSHEAHGSNGAGQDTKEQDAKGQGAGNGNANSPETDEPKTNGQDASGQDSHEAHGSNGAGQDAKGQDAKGQGTGSGNANSPETDEQGAGGESAKQSMTEQDPAAGSDAQ